MSGDAVQRAVDALAEDLRRSVVVNDPDVRLMYGSRHFGDEDAVRVRAVLDRDVGADVARHVLQQGILGWRRPQRIPPLESVGLHGRVGVPLRHGSTVLGMLLVIDADCSLTAEELDRLGEAAERLAALIGAALGDAAGRELDAVVASLLDRRPGVRRGASTELRSRTGRTLQGPARVVAVGTFDRADDPVAASAIRRALDVARSELPEVVLSTVVDRVGLLLGVGPQVSGEPVILRAAEALRTGVVSMLAPGPSAHVGIGAVAGDVETAWRSAREAVLAARAARRSGEALGRWDGADLPSLLARVSDEELDPTAVPSELVRLQVADPSGRLLETLRVYLDRAGSATAAAEALFVHRTTLYYRIERIRELVGVDLDDGRTRTRLHVGLAVLRARPDLLDLSNDTPGAFDD